MALAKSPELIIPSELIEAIRSFPTARQVEHCGQSFSIGTFDIYAKCPQCAKRLKVRSFAAATEIEDVFDAVFGWMSQPENAELARQRMADIAADED